MSDDGLLEQLRAENARLIALLETHGIEWRQPAELPKPEQAVALPPLVPVLNTDEKLALFKRLFRGVPMSFPCVGKARLERPATHLHARMNGAQVCARSPGSNVAIARTGSYYR